MHLSSHSLITAFHSQVSGRVERDVLPLLSFNQSVNWSTVQSWSTGCTAKSVCEMNEITTAYVSSLTVDSLGGRVESG